MGPPNGSEPRLGKVFDDDPASDGSQMELAGALRCIIPLTVGLIMDDELSGAEVEIAPPSGPARITFPDWFAGSGRDISAPSGFGRLAAQHLPSKTWGDRLSPGQARLNAVALTMDLSGNWLELDGEVLPTSFETLVVGGSDLDEIKAQLRAWLQRFCRWTQVVLGQPLDIVDPVQGVLDIRGVEMVTWIEVDGRKSWLDSRAQRTRMINIVLPSSGTAASERVINKVMLKQLIDLTNRADEPPLPIALMGAARIAIRRQRRREAIIHLGTAVEAIATQVASGLTGKTLGAIVAGAALHGIALPADIRDRLLRPRNDAVHRGIEPDVPTALRAADIVDGLIRQHLPGYSPDLTAAVAARQPLQSLTILVPPGGSESQPRR